MEVLVQTVLALNMEEEERKVLVVLVVEPLEDIYMVPKEMDTHQVVRLMEIQLLLQEVSLVMEVALHQQEVQLDEVVDIMEDEVVETMLLLEVVVLPISEE
jgi:hypothetical protein